MKKKILQSLTLKSEFKNVFEQGRKFPSRHLIIYVRPNGLDHGRLGLAVSRKVGKAVVRNRVRRRIREIFRKLFVEQRHCSDFVVVARSTAPDAAFQDLEAGIRKVFAGLKHEKTVHSDHQAL